jgi:hypothetical protein
MEQKARRRKRYIAEKLNEFKKVLGIFESKQKNGQFKKGNEGRKPKSFNSRTLVTLILSYKLTITFINLIGSRGNDCSQ